MTISYIWFDGAARGNPGLAGAGAVFRTPNGQEFSSKLFLKKSTNNVAEYNGLLLGIKMALDYFKNENKESIKILTIFGDSELIIKQMNGEYKIKNQKLIPLAKKVKELLDEIRRLQPNLEVKFEHLFRDKNKKADLLANQAINEHFTK